MWHRHNKSVLYLMSHVSLIIRHAWLSCWRATSLFGFGCANIAVRTAFMAKWHQKNFIAVEFASEWSVREYIYNMVVITRFVSSFASAKQRTVCCEHMHCAWRMQVSIYQFTDWRHPPKQWIHWMVRCHCGMVPVHANASTTHSHTLRLCSTHQFRFRRVAFDIWLPSTRNT